MGLLLVRIELGTLALIQYNKLARCLLVNRPKPFFRHVRPSWQNQCRGAKECSGCESRLSYVCVRFWLRLSRISLVSVSMKISTEGGFAEKSVLNFFSVLTLCPLCLCGKGIVRK